MRKPSSASKRTQPDGLMTINCRPRSGLARPLHTSGEDSTSRFAPDCRSRAVVAATPPPSALTGVWPSPLGSPTGEPAIRLD
jgi:hypothetical protein